MSENKEKKNGRLVPSYLEVILIVLIVTSGAIYGYDRIFAQKIKVVDMSGYLRQQKALLATGEISAGDLKAGLNKLDRVVSLEAGRHKNHVVILKEVVLKNGDEIDIQ